MYCAIWYHLYNSKNVKNTHGGVSISVNCRLLPCNFFKSNTPPWESNTPPWYKWYQIAQRNTNNLSNTGPLI